MTRPLRVLHLEDSPRDAEIIRHRLDVDGLACHIVVANGKDSFEAALAGDPFDLIISDYNLPGYDGVTALKQAQAVQPDVPVILISGTVDEEQAVNCLHIGATDYLLKDRLERLVPAVQRAMQEAETQRARRRGETALGESESRKAAVLDSVLDCIVTMDAKGIVLEFNAAAERTFGYTKAEAIGRLLADLIIPPRFRDRHRDGLARHVATGDGPLIGKVIEIMAVRSDGSEIPVELAITAIRAGSAQIFTGVLRDITERKRADATRARLAAIVDSSDDAISGMAMDGTILTWNAGAERLYGYEAREVIGQNPVLLVPAERRAELRLIMERASRGDAGELVESQRIRKDGSVVDVSLVVSPMTDPAGRVTSVSTIARDITGRKKADAELKRLGDEIELQRVREVDVVRKRAEDLEHQILERRRAELTLRKTTADLVERTKALEEHATALDESENRTNYALGAARMGVWEVDMATQRLTWSETMAPIFGLTSTQAPTSAEAFFALIHPDDRQMFENAVNQAARAGTEYDVEFRVQRSDGSTRWVGARGRMLRDAGDKPLRLFGVGTDISERKSLEAQLRQAQKMDAIGQLAGGVAHDFNNLLTAILGYSNFVIDTLGPQDARRCDMEEVIRAGQRAAGLTRQLLAFSRKQVLQPTAVDLNTLVTGIRPMLSRLIGEHVELVPILSANLCTVRADLGQLEQVIMNLVVNARDAMPTGGRVTVETAMVELDQSFMQDVLIHPGSYAMLAVSDNGAGMDEETKRRLFEPFFTTKEAGKGTGLGLATVYGIVKQSGGYIWVYSQPGQGATFKVYLPSTHRDDAVEQRVVAVPAAAVATETVLVVEDEDAVRILMCRILGGTGYRVFDAASPQQAEALFEQPGNFFDLLVTDVVMPGSSGPQLFERLARHRPDLKVLYVSGYTDDTIVHRGKLNPGLVLLQKPFTADALNRRVREVLDR